MPSAEAVDSAVAKDASRDPMLAAFERQVAAAPGHAAILSERGVTTYRELAAMSDAVATAIPSNALGGSSAPIGIMVREVSHCVAAILGAAKAGRIYMPLELELPEARLSAILEKSGADMIIADEASMDLATRSARTRSRVIEVGEALSPGARTPKRPAEPSPDSPALIIYTSGSTGAPKGVVHGHRYLTHFAGVWSRCVQLRAGDRVGILYGCGVSAGLNRSLSTLLVGGCLCPFDVNANGLSGLAEWIDANGISLLALTSSLFRTWLSSLPDDRRLAKLRLIEVATEPLYGADVSRAARHLGDDCKIVNLYGASEAGMIAAAAFGVGDAAEGILPVGISPEGQEVRILREDGTDADPGESGEILVKGPSVALGYWNEPALTAAVFSADPRDGWRIYRSGDLGRRDGDGQLAHLGRKDRKVKLRGYSVELHDVESALLRLAGVRDAVALVIDKGGDDKRLVAYVAAPDGSSRQSAAALRSGLESQLPSYMVPSRIVVLTEMPLTERGKIDRAALPPVFEPETAPHGKSPQPADDVERALAAIWQDVLQISELGVEDDFHALGGSSLQAFTILAKIAKRFGRDLPTSTMLTAPTIAAQARILRGEAPTPDWSKPAPLRSAGPETPLFFVHAAFGSILFARDLAHHLKTDRSVFGLQAPPLDATLARNPTIESIAADYLTEIRSLQPRGPYFLAGYSFGGWVVFEMAQQLVRRGETVGFLAMIDPIRHGPAEGEALASRARRHFNALPKKNFRALVSYVERHAAWKLGYGFARWRLAISRRLPTLLSARLPVRPPHAYRSALYNEVYSRASARHEPRPYPGKAVVFSAAGQRAEHQAFWQPLVKGELTVIEIQAGHKEMIRPPHSALLAEHFDNWLGQPP